MAHPQRLDDPAKLPEILKRERLRRKDELTWKDLAAAAGVQYQSLQAFEEGKAPLTLKTLRGWLRRLDLPEGWALDWRDWRLEQDNEELMTRAGFSAEQKQLGRIQFRQQLRIRREET